MGDAIESVVDGRAGDLEVLGRLHDVPPHEVYEVSVDGRRAVCKISVESRGSAGVEGRVCRYVGRETAIPVPEVLDVGENWFLMAYRDDAPQEPADDERRLEPTWLRTAGRTLARLHAEARFDRPGLFATAGDPTDAESELRVDAPADATWPDALDDLLGLYESTVADRTTDKAYARAIADAREFLAAHAARFVNVDDRPSLLHGWFTPEHVGVADGEPTCVIDFEHALVGSPAWDYWRLAVVLFQSSNWEAPDDAESQFRRSYESVRPLPDGFEERADAYRAFVAASHLDSLVTQRGIDDETRELATFLTEYIQDRLDDCRDRWS